MQEFSENWGHLRAILTGYARNDQIISTHNFSDHLYSEALSVFLTHASLATPPLDRTTVKAVLDGSFKWANSEDSAFDNTEVQLSLLEEIGLVSFCCGWCTVHCNNVSDRESLDKSLIPIIEAVDHLKDIISGRNGYIRPRYACSENILRAKFREEFGDKFTVENLLTDLLLEDGVFSLQPGNKSFGQLPSTYFWQRLRKTLTAEQAFSQWIMCMRVNCDWAMPVIFDLLEYSERELFNEQLSNHLESDPDLTLSLEVYRRQMINEHSFSRLLNRVPDSHSSNSVDFTELSKTIRAKALPATTASTLDEIFPEQVTDQTTLLTYVAENHKLRHDGREDFFYTGLLADAAEASIRIDGQRLWSSGLVERLLQLSETRPVLKFLLLNTLPDIGIKNYTIFLLARADTSEVGFYHLAQKRFEPSRKSASYVQALEDGYHYLICQEYLQSVKDETDCASRLMHIASVLGGQCALGRPNFNQSFEYRLFNKFLDTLDDQQALAIVDVLVQKTCDQSFTSTHSFGDHYIYMLVFWLIERIQTTGIDPSGDVCKALREYLTSYYASEFSENMDGKYSLEPNEFFAALPWNKLVTDSPPDLLLSMSNDTCHWKHKLNMDSSGATPAFKTAYGIQHYLLVLMRLGRPVVTATHLRMVAARVQEIVRLCGFGFNDRSAQLFLEIPRSDTYDLWGHFCAYSNSLRDDLYEDLVARWLPKIPLSNLIALSDRTATMSRRNKLQPILENRQVNIETRNKLEVVDQLFVAACEADRIDDAERLLSSAKATLAEPRYEKDLHPRTRFQRNTWKSYEYKLALLKLLRTLEFNPEKFQTAAREVAIPHERPSNNNAPDNWFHYRACENYRQQLTAMAFVDTDPAKCVKWMENLCIQTERDIHRFLLLWANLKLYLKEKKKTVLHNALASFLRDTGSVAPQLRSEDQIATILEVYRHIDGAEIDEFWVKLSFEQQARWTILKPYCRSLISRGEPSSARLIIGRFQTLNAVTLDQVDADDLVSELAKAEPDAPSAREMLNMMIEGGQRSTIQLRKHYAEIVSTNFERYIDIISPGRMPHEFIKDIVLDVASEIILRKRHLQVKTDKRKTGHRITDENTLNDWFTSLFDMRLAEARVGFRDQKRTGQSESGASPGQSDGMFTSAKNQRVAIFEAFRLSSVQTRVISTHLDKIAGYDAEALSTVVMVAYCDTENFSGLCKDYESFVSARAYTGFTKGDLAHNNLRVINDAHPVWLAVETRLRGTKEIILYHLLIDLYFTPPHPLKKGERTKATHSPLGLVTAYKKTV